MNPEMGPRTETSDDVAIGTLEQIAELNKLAEEAESEGRHESASTYRRMIAWLLEKIGL